MIVGRLAVVLTLVATVVLVPAAPAAAAMPSLTHIGDAGQVIVVSGRGWASTYATLRAYQLGADGKWRQAFAAMPARIGYGGWVWAARRVQDTGKTPAGTFTITQAFG